MSEQRATGPLRTSRRDGSDRGGLSVEGNAEANGEPGRSRWYRSSGGRRRPQLKGEAAMSEPSGSRRESDDAMARESLEVSEDVQPVTTDEDSDKTAQGSLEGTAGPERTDTADNMQTE
jgi:hypothetical protein